MPLLLEKNKFFVITLFAVLLFFIPAKSQVPNEIIQSLKSGNARALSAYFNQNVELVIPESDNVYSKAQAQLIVSDFFSSYPPSNFLVIHQGGKEGAFYVIGSLVTSKGYFRVYFLLKKNEGKDFIHQLRIEKQEKPNE
ncbi:MAG: DUF4783 domain-containing protein [Mariniphaga sp.]|nr:DUF4783 domain-containing protein [Mariniphaga sp.]